MNGIVQIRLMGWDGMGGKESICHVQFPLKSKSHTRDSVSLKKLYPESCGVFLFTVYGDSVNLPSLNGKLCVKLFLTRLFFYITAPLPSPGLSVSSSLASSHHHQQQPIPPQQQQQQQSSPSLSTKILYFTSRSVTPFMSTVRGKTIGEVTLRDFKSLFDRPGFFRFHFKTVDKEFGMVKEEV